MKTSKENTTRTASGRASCQALDAMGSWFSLSAVLALKVRNSLCHPSQPPEAGTSITSPMEPAWLGKLKNPLELLPVSPYGPSSQSQREEVKNMATLFTSLPFLSPPKLCCHLLPGMECFLANYSWLFSSQPILTPAHTVPSIQQPD